MRVTSLLRKVIGIADLWVTGCREDAEGALAVAVRPTWRAPRCSGCGQLCPARPGLATEKRRWRHLDLCGVELYLEYDVRWVSCGQCGRVVERVPWAAEPRSRFTDEFDLEVAHRAQHTDKSTVERQMRIAWRTVGRIIERVLRRIGPRDPLANLSAIGVDELSYRKGHYYLTLVTDLVTRKVVWGKEGKDAATLLAFFEELGQERRAAIEQVCMDMSGAFMSAAKAKEGVPHAEIVFDRFHVQQLAGEAVDEARRAEWQRVRGDAVLARSVKYLRWALLKNPMNLTEAEQARLVELPRQNRGIYRAYLLKEALGDILDGRQVNVARKLLESWCSWASRSRLPGFVRVSRTVRKHQEGILNYVRWRLTNGPTEGLNNKARLITRRAYGFHSAEAVLAMIRLCCSGLDVAPVHYAITA